MRELLRRINRAPIEMMQRTNLTRREAPERTGIRRAAAAFDNLPIIGRVERQAWRLREMKDPSVEDLRRLRGNDIPDPEP